MLWKITASTAGSKFTSINCFAFTLCSSNSVTAQCDMICDFNGIKRMRLDSSDKEKNIQLEMERQCSSSAVSCGASALEPSSPTLDPARLKEAIEADR